MMMTTLGQISLPLAAVDGQDLFKVLMFLAAGLYFVVKVSIDRLRQQNQAGRRPGMPNQRPGNRPVENPMTELRDEVTDFLRRAQRQLSGEQPTLTPRQER